MTRPSLLLACAALCTPLFAGAEDTLDSLVEQARKQRESASAGRPVEQVETQEQALQRWLVSADTRLKRVESTCFKPADLKAKTCARSGVYHIRKELPPFQYDPTDSFDKAAQNVDTAQAMMFAKKFHGSEGWWELIAVAYRGIFDKASSDRKDEEPNRRAAAMTARYADMITRAGALAVGLTDEQKAAFATCISRNSFDGYDEDEADAVEFKGQDPLLAARTPTQSFLTSILPKRTGRGVCRDYAAVAAEAARAMGMKKARVVGSGPHAMAELTFANDEIILVEPQWDALNTDCKLFTYAK